MKRITVLILLLALLAAPFAAQATSLSDLGDKPEDAPRVMPAPTVVNVPRYRTDTSDKFLGRVVLPNGTNGLGYEFSSFPADPWVQMQVLVRYDNRLIAAGYSAPRFDSFSGENQQYIRFTATGKPDLYVLPYLKKDSLIVIIEYPNSVLNFFPADVSTEDALTALVSALNSADERKQAAQALASVWRTTDMERAVIAQLTPDNMETLLPLLIRSDFFTKFEDDGTVNVASSLTDLGKYLHKIIVSQGSGETALSLAARAAAAVVPVIDERYLDVSHLVWNTSSDMRGDNVTEQLPPIPPFDPADDVPENLKDDGGAHRYVVVCDYSGEYSLVPYLSVLLPADQIAGSIAEADRIIVCHNYKQKSAGNWTGGTPNDSMTRIDLYSADGTLICRIGSATNRQGMISHGDLPHDWIEMGEVIRAYFAR